MVHVFKKAVISFDYSFKLGGRTVGGEIIMITLSSEHP